MTFDSSSKFTRRAADAGTTQLPWVSAMTGVLRLPAADAAVAHPFAGSRPAASGLGGALKGVWARIVRTADLMASRRALLAMDERMLKDLGVSRAQAEFEATRSPWHRAAGSLPLHEDSWR